MRIDKYLKVARVLKRREIGKQLALNERLYVNDKPVKPSKEIEPGDIIKIVFGTRILVIRVLEVRESASKQQAFAMYEVVDQQIKEEV